MGTKNKEYASVPGIESAPGGFDKEKDYMASMRQKAGAGDYVGAAADEKARNQKIGELGLPYSPTNYLNWSDPNGYGKEKLMGEIDTFNKEGFRYNPEEDAVLKSLDNRYKKQALDNYNEDISSLAARYGGEIPAYLKQIAKNGYNEASNKANEAIPSLSELAWQMWGDQRNDMYNRYSILEGESDRDYNRFSNDRDLFINTADKMYQRGIDERNFDYNAAIDERNYNRGVLESDRDYGRRVYEDDRNYEYGVKSDRASYINSQANNYIKMGIAKERAIELASEDYNKLYGGGEPVENTVPASAISPKATNNVSSYETPKKKETIGRVWFDGNGNIHFE